VLTTVTALAQSSRYDDADSFYNHALSTVVTLIASRYDDPDTFYQHVIGASFLRADFFLDATHALISLFNADVDVVRPMNASVKTVYAMNGKVETLNLAGSTKQLYGLNAEVT